MARSAFWALAVYEAVRVGDLVVRGQLGAGSSRAEAALLAAELLLGGVVPLVLLGVPTLRARKGALFAGALLAILRRGAQPRLRRGARDGPEGPDAADRAAPYTPSAFEWGVSAGLVAATIFLFGLGVRYLPVLPKEEPAAESEAAAGGIGKVA